MIEQLAIRVFAARDLAHLAHWSSKSFSQHSALGDFYEGVIPVLDDIVELSQGVGDLIEVNELPKVAKPKDILAFLEDEAVWIGENRKKITQGIPAIDNKLQELEAIYFRTIYKLKNLG